MFYVGSVGHVAELLLRHGDDVDVFVRVVEL